MNPIGIHDAVQRAWASALLDDQIEDSMDTPPSKDQRTKYGSENNVIVKISRSKIRA